MIRSCYIAIYYRLIIYSNIKDVLFGQEAAWLVKLWYWHLSWKVIWWTSWRIRQLMAKQKVVHKWVGLGRVQSFMLILGRVGFGHFTCGSGGTGQENWTHVQLWSSQVLQDRSAEVPPGNIPPVIIPQSDCVRSTSYCQFSSFLYAHSLTSRPSSMRVGDSRRPL